MYYKARNSVTTLHMAILRLLILGDPGADSGGEGKSKRAEKYIGNEEK